MSARKTVSRYLNTPGSGVKSNTKAKPLSTKQALNATTISRSPPRLKAALTANTTINATGACFAPKVVATDWGLQCDLAYDDYLRALMAKDILQSSIKQHEKVIDDQLAYQAELLQRAVSEETKLKSEVQDLEIQIEIEKLSAKLQQAYGEINEIIEGYNVDKNLSSCIRFSENACNKLYLKNIKCFKTQEDYDKFSTSLQSCAETMKKLKVAVCSIDDMQILGEYVQKFLLLQDEFIRKRKMFLDLQKYVGLNLFKNVSDTFAYVRGYNED